MVRKEQKEQSLVYTLILGVCILASLMLVGKMLLHHPVPEHIPYPIGSDAGQEEERDSMRFTEKDMAGLVAARLPEGFPITDISILISKEGEVSAQGTIAKQALSMFISNGFLRSALMFMPDSFRVRADCVVQQEHGQVTLIPARFSAGSMEFPVDVLPAEMLDTLNGAINEALQASGQPFSSVALRDGAIELMP